MKERVATEQAFRNGFQAGYAAGRRSAGREWIPVADGLPRNTNLVLTCRGRDGIFIEDYTKIGGWTLNGTAKELDDVTHWMPLPVPPGEDDYCSAGKKKEATE